MELIFASNNAHKKREVAEVLGEKFTIRNLAEIGYTQDIPEPHDTFVDNSFEKANTIFQAYGKTCFADDSGLEVEALGGAPGVFSARYAGEGCSFEDNIQKLLLAMEGKTNRNAQFVTVIALILEDGSRHVFEGIVTGTIPNRKLGEKGFGYDPVFIPSGYDLSFAQMTAQQKNSISHRGIALDKLRQFLIRL